MLEEIPGAGERLLVTQMGGAVDYRDPSRAEHNVRMDVASAHTVFKVVREGLLPEISLVTSDVTFRSEIQVTRESTLYSLLSAGTGWKLLFREHLDL
ncbi:hypothetical protein [Nocardiopsis algeriensis]|uniref:Inosine-uridine nucleoside N-ribohydrolase n=1 Tax=Nocardiopsis algeriensis TaxID=1478215 RepID=A0A841IQS8_9ACTN|nr:inosine-uridine nucleoside N-ribohydrolase [Nocardiopsis algeriensis]